MILLNILRILSKQTATTYIESDVLYITERITNIFVLMLRRLNKHWIDTNYSVKKGQIFLNLG